MNVEKATGPLLYQEVWRAYRALADHNQLRLRELELGGLTEFAVLECLFKDGPQPVNTIGRRVMLTSGSITAAVDRLEKHGWVRRAASSPDRRVVEVHLTPSGRKTAREASKRHGSAIDEICEELTATERNQLLQMLRRLSGRVEALQG